jgi:hypothetical protein
VSAEQLRVQAGKTSWTVRREGHSKILQCMGQAGLGRKFFTARGFTCFAGQRPVRQRSILADLIIHSLFVFNGVNEVATLSIWFFSSRKRTKASAVIAGKALRAMAYPHACRVRLPRHSCSQ